MKKREGEASGNADVPVGIVPFVADEDFGVPRSLALPNRGFPDFYFPSIGAR